MSGRPSPDRTTPASPRGHSAGLYGFFSKEAWERFNCLLTRALLVLYPDNHSRVGHAQPPRDPGVRLAVSGACNGEANHTR